MHSNLINRKATQRKTHNSFTPQDTKEHEGNGLKVSRLLKDVVRGAPPVLSVAHPRSNCSIEGDQTLVRPPGRSVKVAFSTRC